VPRTAIAGTDSAQGKAALALLVSNLTTLSLFLSLSVGMSARSSSIAERSLCLVDVQFALLPAHSKSVWRSLPTKAKQLGRAIATKVRAGHQIYAWDVHGNATRAGLPYQGCRVGAVLHHFGQIMNDIKIPQ
jgi:hypothetical protein